MARHALDLNRIGALARRDIGAALREAFRAAGGARSLGGFLPKEAPPQWPPDLLPWLRWASERFDEQPGDSPAKKLVHLLHPAVIVKSPMIIERGRLRTGDVIPPPLASKLRFLIRFLDGEGSRLMVLDPVVVVVAKHLGYARASRTPIRTRRVGHLEHQAIGRCLERLKEAQKTRNALEDGNFRLLRRQFELLLHLPNHRFPATLEHLRTLTSVQRTALWSLAVEYHRRSAMAPDLRWTQKELGQRLKKLNLKTDLSHVGRLVGLAARIGARLHPDPLAARGIVQATLKELKDYLAGRPRVRALRPYATQEGVRLINLALLQLTSGQVLSDWPPGFGPALVEFRDDYLRPLHARTAEWLNAIDPIVLLDRELEIGRERTFPLFGDVDRIVAAWTDLEWDILRFLKGKKIQWSLEGDHGVGAAGASEDDDDDAGVTIQMPVAALRRALQGAGIPDREADDDEIDGKTVQFESVDHLLEAAEEGADEGSRSDPADEEGSHGVRRPGESTFAAEQDGEEPGDSVWINVGAPEVYPLPIYEDGVIVSVGGYPEEVEVASAEDIEEIMAVSGSFEVEAAADDDGDALVIAAASADDFADEADAIEMPECTGSIEDGETTGPAGDEGEATGPIGGGEPPPIPSGLDPDLEGMVRTLGRVVEDLERYEGAGTARGRDGDEEADEPTIVRVPSPAAKTRSPRHRPPANASPSPHVVLDAELERMADELGRMARRLRDAGPTSARSPSARAGRGRGKGRKRGVTSEKPSSQAGSPSGGGAESSTQSLPDASTSSVQPSSGRITQKDRESTEQTLAFRRASEEAGPS